MSEILECGHEESPHNAFTTGYGYDAQGNRHCYACCAEQDKQTMRETGKYTLYLVKRDDGYHVTNWPASLDFKVKSYRTSRHNIGGTRVDVWFMFEDKEWHGYQIGGYNEICHCKRNKYSLTLENMSNITPNQ